MGINEICALSFLGMCSIDDIKTKQIRLSEVIVFSVLAVIIQIFTDMDWMKMLYGLMTGGVIYIFSCMTNEEIGKGDAFLIMVLGLYLGFWKTMGALWVGSILVGFYGLILLGLKKQHIGYEVAFAPFLLVGAITVLATQGFVEAVIWY